MRRAPVSILVQVAALAAVAVTASQLVAFALVLTAPPPRPAGFSVAAAGDALLGRPAETTDGRALKRRLSDRPVLTGDPDDPFARAVGGVLAQRVGVDPGLVQVRMQGGPRRWTERPPPGEAIASRETRTFVVSSRPRADGEPPQPVVVARETTGPIVVGPGGGEIQELRIARPSGSFPRISIQADRLSFPPFAASVRLADGRWATVEPPQDLIAPWQARLMISLLISLAILAPLVWLMAQRMTRPIRAFALAADRLGADPEAEPLPVSGPAEVRTAVGAFNDMQASLRGHIRRRTQTVAAIAHDLRTPLTRLRFRAEQAPAPLRARMTADIEEMDALIGQAMAFVRGEAPVERRDLLDLAALVEGCVRDFAETGADVQVRAEGDRLMVQGDAAALKRAVGNLIENAVKFAGGARVALGAAEGVITVTVEDDGPGLDEGELEAVFEPFVRGERSRNRETGGAGLGLAVARQAARAHGGEVALVNRVGGGLVATLHLPQA